MLLKYSARNCPVGHPPPAGLTVNVTAFDVCPSGLRTLTGTAPAAATSEAGVPAITRAALTKVVPRAAPLQSRPAPAAKLLPTGGSVARRPSPRHARRRPRL